MVDTTTPVLGLVKQTIGGNRNTWGGILNSCMDLIEGAFYGMTSVAVTGAGDVTLTDTQRRKRILAFSGTLTAHQTIIIANLVGHWRVRNATTGNFDLKIKTASGTAITIPQGGHCDVWCDGADGMYAGLSTRLRDTQMLFPSGTLAAPGASWSAEIDSGWYRISSNLFAFVVNAIEKIRVGADTFKLTLGSAVEVIAATSTTFVMKLGASTIFSASASGIDFTVPLTVNGAAPVPIGGEIDYAGIFEPSGWVFKDGRALDRDDYALLFAVVTATANATRNGTTTLSSVDEDFTGLGLEGAEIEGTGIASDTTIVSLTSNSITLSQAASGSGTMEIRIFPHGNGDGSTTFNVPDDKGRATVGRDNMGGTSANRLTGQTGGINGDKLGATGGEESHTLTKAESPSGLITLNDPGHNHNTTAGFTGVGGGGVLSAGGTAVQNVAITSNTKTTGITLTDNGSDDAHNNVQPSRVTNKIIFTGVFA